MVSTCRLRIGSNYFRKYVSNKNYRSTIQNTSLPSFLQIVTQSTRIFPRIMSNTVDGLLGEEVEDAMALERWVGSVAVVTGASSGTGAAICEKLLRAKINVIGLARRVHLVQEIGEKNCDAKATLFPVACDLQSEEKILQAFRWIDKHFGGISILVNNAGVLAPTTLIDGNTELWKRTVDVNFTALALCTREAVKSMMKYDIDGHILNINSICGHYIPHTKPPRFNVYPSTKHAVTAFSETLKRELNFADVKIKVSMISPGAINTELNYDVAAAAALDPNDVAEACVYILSTPPHVTIQDLMIRVIGEAL